MTSAGAILALCLLVGPWLLVVRRLGTPAPLETALVLGTLSVFQAVLLLQLLGLPIAWFTALPLVLGGAAALTWVASSRGAPEPGGAGSGCAWLPAGPRWGMAALVGFGALLLLRTSLQPLSGFDTPFRWEHLALLMLDERSLDMYPPRTSAHFARYFWPDSISPLTSSAYWWVYAFAGEAVPRWTSPLLLAQWGATCLVTWRLGAHLGGARVGALAAFALATSPLFFRAVAIGQETGLTALAFMTAITLVLTANGGDQLRSLALAGAAAAVAALAREYGWAFVAVLSVLVYRRTSSWRGVLVFTGVALALAAPWYVRNAVLTGNPLYPHALLGFEAPATYAMLETGARDQLAWVNAPGMRLAQAARELLLYAAIPVLLGGAGCVLWARRLAPLATSALLVFALWAWSVPSTQGGLIYALRITSPALALLSIPAGLLLERLLTGSRPARLGAGVALALASAWGVVGGAMFPERPGDVPLRALRPYLTSPVRSQDVFETALGARLEARFPSGVRLLSSSPYPATAANREAGIEVIPLWSPEVAFLFDPATPIPECVARLRALRIAGYVRHLETYYGPVLLRLPLFRERARTWFEVERAAEFVVFVFDRPQALGAAPSAAEDRVSGR